MIERRRGQSVLYAVLLMPMLFLVLAMAIDIGMLQLDRLRLHYAVDLAAVTAAGAVDANAYRRSGILQLDAAAAPAVVRQSLLSNLSRLPDTADPEQIAGSADIAVVNRLPGRDPYTGTALERPAVCIRIRVPHRFALLGWIGMSANVITITGEAEIRT